MDCERLKNVRRFALIAVVFLLRRTADYWSDDDGGPPAGGAACARVTLAAPSAAASTSWCNLFMTGNLGMLASHRDPQGRCLVSPELATAWRLNQRL